METFTIEQFQEDFDNLLERVENGESFLITSDSGDVVIVPYSQVEGTELDEIVKVHIDHNDGC